MTEPAAPSPAREPLAAPKRPAPERVFLVPYPKIVFLYPVLLASIAAAICVGMFGRPLDESSKVDVVVATLFLGITGVNLVILAFDFPRTTSLTLFFFAAAVVMGCVLLFTFHPDIWPFLTGIMHRFRPVANATFYWAIACLISAIFLVVFVVVRFDYWEVRPNELLHHHGFLSNLERFSAPHLQIEKEISDVFEYLLLRSGRLILQPSGERRPIILDNVPFISQKEEAITRMLGALQVQVREENAAP